MKEKVYISGPISSLTEEEYTDAFGRAEATLLRLDFEPVNPLKVLACELQDCADADSKKSNGEYLHAWHCYMKHDLKAMLECDAIAMLPDWITSTGAAIEKNVASVTGLKLYHFDSKIEEIY